MQRLRIISAVLALLLAPAAWAQSTRIHGTHLGLYDAAGNQVGIYIGAWMDRPMVALNIDGHSVAVSISDYQDAGAPLTPFIQFRLVGDQLFFGSADCSGQGYVTQWVQAGLPGFPRSVVIRQGTDLVLYVAAPGRPATQAYQSYLDGIGCHVSSGVQSVYPVAQAYVLTSIIRSPMTLRPIK